MSKKLKKELHVILAALVIFFAVLIAEKAGLFPGLFGNRWLSVLPYLIPYLLAGYDVLRKAFLGIIHGQVLDESFLMTIASIGAFVTGEAEEAAAVMLFYQIGEWFQRYALGQSRQSITELMDLAPDYANLELEDGSTEEIDPEDIEPGCILVVKPGEKIPIDGTVLSGSSLINTAALTGESVPRPAGPGDSVISGCINGDGLLRIRAEKAYEDSTVARILELVENATEKKSHTENFITRFARCYTPLVVGAAVLLAVIPSLVSGHWMTWIYRACTFLVISCPCALVISIPLAFFGGIGAASKNGVLVKGSNYLELLAQIDTLVSDKTGTLTMGNFTVSEIVPASGGADSGSSSNADSDRAKQEILYAAACAEGMSTHPIAVSIRQALSDCNNEAPAGSVNSGSLRLPPVEKTENISGRGLVSVVDGDEILVGNAGMMEENGIAFTPVENAAATICYVAKNGEYLGAILIRDTVKPDAAPAIAAMKSEGVGRIVMMTGDHREVGEAVAAELGVDEVFSEMLPQDKVAKLEELLESTGKGSLAFIGDGMNDAPTLSRADLGIAMGAIGSDAAIEAADVVIMDDDLTRIPAVIGIARKTQKIARQNIVFALAVKALILVLGALGAAGMWAAVFADVGVAVLCILNSMRLLLVKRTI